MSHSTVDSLRHGWQRMWKEGSMGQTLRGGAKRGGGATVPLAVMLNRPVCNGCCCHLARFIQKTLCACVKAPQDKKLYSYAMH